MQVSRRILTALAATVTIAMAATIGSPGHVDALPTGFTDTPVVGTFLSPTAIEQLPNGRVVVLEQSTGRVRLIDTATRTPLSAPALDLDVCGGSERGLLGFTHDPDFGRTGRVYVYYTRPAGGFPGGCVNRVSAFTMRGDTIDPATEQVLIDNISSVNGNHNGGDVEIGNDGYLYIAIGDAGRNPRGGSGSAASDLSLLNGKILRLDRFTGAPAAGNPVGGSGAVACGSRGNTPTTPATFCREIFAWGLRNPYRFAFDPNTASTDFFINDVGQNTYEEVDRGQIGADYGWPEREGPCPQGQTPPCAPNSAYVEPITAYPHGGLGRFITAGAFVPDGVWPAAYDGGYLFVDGGSGKMWLRRANGTVDYGNPFANVSPGVADMAFVLEPDGYALWYTVNGGNAVRRISSTRSASPPSGPQRFQQLDTPTRVFDSREQTPATRLRGGTTRLIDVQAPGGATAALVNLTLVRPVGRSFASVWEPRRARPASSNVNAPDGQVVANASIVPVDAQGRILLYTRASTDAVIDVSGYFVPTAGATKAGRLEVREPVRLIDTRQAPGNGNGYSRTPGGPDDDFVRVPVAGTNGVPGHAGSVVLSAVGLSGTIPGSGFVSVFAGGSTPPTASNLNVNGRTGTVADRRANLVVAPVGGDGTIEVQLHRVDDVVLDLVGWFTDAGAPSSASGRFVRTVPTREVDTRIPVGFGPLPANGTATLNPGSIPDDAIAVAQNLTLAGTVADGFLTAWPDGPRPSVSNLNSTGPGQVRAALAMTRLAGGSEHIYSQRGTQLVVDVYGYFR